MTSKEVANIIKKIIDDYWETEATENDKTQASHRIGEIMKDRNNKIKVFRGDIQTAVFSKTMGVRRLLVFLELYNRND